MQCILVRSDLISYFMNSNSYLLSVSISKSWKVLENRYLLMWKECSAVLAACHQCSSVRVGAKKWPFILAPQFMGQMFRKCSLQKRKPFPGLDVTLASSAHHRPLIKI